MSSSHCTPLVVLQRRERHSFVLRRQSIPIYLEVAQGQSARRACSATGFSASLHPANVLTMTTNTTRKQAVPRIIGLAPFQEYTPAFSSPDVLVTCEPVWTVCLTHYQYQIPTSEPPVRPPRCPRFTGQDRWSLYQTRYAPTTHDEATAHRNLVRHAINSFPAPSVHVIAA